MKSLITDFFAAIIIKFKKKIVRLISAQFPPKNEYNEQNKNINLYCITLKIILFIKIYNKPLTSRDHNHRITALWRVYFFNVSSINYSLCICCWKIAPLYAIIILFLFLFCFKVSKNMIEKTSSHTLNTHHVRTENH